MGERRHPSAFSERRHAIIAARIARGDRLVDAHAVVVDAGRIVDVVAAGALPHDIPVLDLGAGILAPGLVDIHVHGAAGHGFDDGQDASVSAAGRALLRAGVTTVLPTLSSAALSPTLRALDAIARVAGDDDVARFAGAHLEGPFLAPAQRGAQTLADLRAPDDGTLDALLHRADEVRMVTLAPELPGAIDAIARIVDHGLIAAAGHSDGTADDLARAQEAGLTHVIHLFSGQSTTRRDGPWRRPGMLEGALASTGLTAEIIADGKHLPPDLMRLAQRALGGSLCLVSDATAGAGLPEGGTYAMGASTYVVRDGVGMTLDGTSFGGSTTLLPEMLAVARDATDAGTAGVIAMATSVPARAAGLTDVGVIAPGMRADFVHLDDDLRVARVARGGDWLPEPTTPR
jgi:N-acetylglucosamine-6-phosphate deacetylase